MYDKSINQSLVEFDMKSSDVILSKAKLSLKSSPNKSRGLIFKFTKSFKKK